MKKRSEPSSVFRATLPVKRRSPHVGGSCIRSRPSALPMKLRPGYRQQGVGLLHQRVPLDFSSPIESRATVGVARRSGRSNRPNPSGRTGRAWRRALAVGAGVEKDGGMEPSCGIGVAMAGRTIPFNRPMRRSALAMVAPVFRLTMARAVVADGLGRRTREESFLRRTLSGSSSIPITSEAGRIARSRCRSVDRAADQNDSMPARRRPGGTGTISPGPVAPWVEATGRRCRRRRRSPLVDFDGCGPCVRTQFGHHDVGHLGCWHCGQTLRPEDRAPVRGASAPAFAWMSYFGDGHRQFTSGREPVNVTRWRRSVPVPRSGTRRTSRAAQRSSGAARSCRPSRCGSPRNGTQPGSSWQTGAMGSPTARRRGRDPPGRPGRRPGDRRPPRPRPRCRARGRDGEGPVA